jgi:ABC-2 type transport system permease protein
MNLNLLFKEIQRNVLSFLLWTVVISVLVSVTMSFFPTFLQNQSKVMGMMTVIPKEALQFKGISNFTDMLSPLGFYSVNNIIYMMVLGSIYAMVLSSNILLKEEYNKTAEYLMVQPITRSEIFISKLTVVIFYIFLLNLISALIGYVTIKLVHSGPFNSQSFFVLSAYTFLLNTLFGATGLFMSTLVKRPKPITTLGIGMVLFFYFIYTLSKITESAAQIGYLSPYKYVRLDAVNSEYKLEPWHLLYFLGISIILLGISYRIYRRKDIYT